MNGGSESPRAADSPATRAHDEARRRSVRAVKWSALGDGVVHGLQPLVMLALAWVLTPEDFGVLGVAMIAIGLAQTLQEFGAGKALVQTPDAVEEHASNAFWINLGLAGLLYAGMLAFAGPIAAFFKSPASEPVLRVLGAQVVLASLVSVQSAILQRDIRYRELFFVRLAPALISAAVAIGLALAGQGVWAIVWGTLAAGVAQVVLYWRASAWRPILGFDRARFRRMFRFSRWVLLESLLAWAIIWGDSAVLGHALGPEALGVYRVGCMIVALASNLVFTPLVPVAFGLLSRLQDDRAAFHETFGKLTRLVILVSLPLGLGLALVGRELTVAVLGPQWAEAGIVVQVMGLRMGFEWVVGMNSTAFAALGRPETNVRLLLIAVVLSLPAYIAAAPFGVLAFCWARLLAALANIAISIGIARQVLKTGAGFVADRLRLPVAGCLAATGVVLAMQLAWPVGGLAFAVAGSLVGLLAYVATLRAVDRTTLAWFVAALRSVLGGR